MSLTERRKVARRLRGTAWAILSILVAIGASPPEVVKVRVPAARVSSFFPAGSDLHILPADRFEEMLRAIRERPEVPRGPRILRARHSARWEAGRLDGRSEFTIEPTGSGASGMVVLEPWSPALTGQGEAIKRLRTTQDGRLALKVVPAGPSSTAIEWQAQARPGSDGRSFTLALPDLDVASLVLDLPSEMVPEATAGACLGPEPGPSPGRSCWRMDAARGRVELRFQNPTEDANRAGAPGLWLEGPTRIDLNESPANWKADWTLDETPGAPRLLTIELDPGLDLVEITGPRVASFRVEPGGSTTRVAIRLDGEGSGPSPLTIRAICHAPPEGVWPLPMARPIDASWTGGRTTVRLDPSRVLQSCLDRSGRRVAPRPGDPGDHPILIFEPNGGPGTVAELTFRKPTADATVDVRGLLRLGDDVPRIEVALTWTVEKGRMLSHAADLPAGWTPDGVQAITGHPVSWHADPLSNGGTRVHVGPSSQGDEARSLTLTIAASARQAGVTGLLDLPRVRPAPGARVVDEVWAASPDPSLIVRPILGRGLAWIDPPDPPRDDIPTPWVADDLRNALVWRWLADDAEARVDRAREIDRPRGDIRLDASIAKGRLHLDWALSIESARGDLGSIPIHLDEPPGAPIRWRSRDASGPTVEARPLDLARSAALGFPRTGSSWELDLSGPSRKQVEIRGQVDRPWSGAGKLPLLTLPDRFRARGLVAIDVEDTSRLAVDASGLTPIDLSESRRDGSSPEEDLVSEGDPRHRRAAMFGYRTRGGRLRVETTEGEAGLVGGLIREAFLVSQVFPGAGLRHRLTLRIASDRARTMEVAMPGGGSLDRLRRDGQPVLAVPSGDSFRVAIPAPAPGRSSCTLTLDYRTVDDPRAGPLEPSRFLPRCSLPCVSFAWELVAPEPWSLRESSRGLVATDSRPDLSWSRRMLGFRSPPWLRTDQDRGAEARDAMLQDLDKVATDLATREMNLGEWLLKLDAGRWPLVVDRLALLSAGWGPGSRTISGSPESRSPNQASAILSSMGLVAIPFDGMILITSRADGQDHSSDRMALAPHLRSVPTDGSDLADRYQSPSRWRGEPTPRALAAGETPDRSPGQTGWRTWRLVASGWPAAGASALLVNERSDTAWGWLVASLVLLVGIVVRNRSPRLRAILLAAGWMFASVGLAWAWPEPGTTATGFFRGVLAVLAFWIGRSFRRSAPATSTDSMMASTLTQRSGFAAGAGTGSMVLVAIGIASMPIFAEPEKDTPILAVLPYEGLPDLMAKPDRVVILLTDYERLVRLARPEVPNPPAGSALVAAEHRVSRDEPGLATVESRYEVEVAGETPASWIMPVGNARDLSARVDDRAAPLVVSGDGLAATVMIAGPGVHSLRFRRMIPLVPVGPGGERFRLPVNSSAFARISVARGDGTRQVEIPGARGSVEDREDGIAGSLGPVEALDVRWFPKDRPLSASLRGPVEANFLWDARPSGDLIRIKLTHNDPDGAAEIRLALEPGLVVRRFSIPDVVGIRREGTAGRPEWVAHIDPPLPRDVPIEVDLWRPAVPGSPDRRWPRVEIPGAGRFSGILGFRRPSDWSGRLEARGGAEPLPEAIFVKAWGTLPDDGLTLAGAVRFEQNPDLGVAIGPVPLRRLVQSKVLADLEPGRMEVTIEGTLSDRQGRSFELEMSVSTEFRVVRVEAVGLVDWQKVARDRIRLQFDGVEAIERVIRVQGYLPVPADSVMSETRSYQARIPWPRWSDSETGPGFLVLSSPIRFQIDPGEGVVAVPTTGPADPEAAIRSSFRVDRPTGLSPVRWSAPPARVGVSVRSDLTIDPGNVTWTAVIVCNVSGGPADSLHWHVPTEWANAASLEIEGISHRLVAEPKGEKGEITLWTILPDSPIWGRARIVLRSKRPLLRGKPFSYPEISPLASPGRGSVERYELAIANVSGRPLEVAGKPGLQPIEVSSSGSDESPSPPSTIAYAYHVTGTRWSLSVRVGREGETKAEVEGEEARVALARLSCTLGWDGQTWGQARYDMEPRHGPFLAVRLPDPAVLSWASIDGSVRPVTREGPGRWLVPLGDREVRRVDLFWEAPPSELTGPGPWTLAYPTTAQPRVPSLMSVTAPVSLAVAGRPRGADRLTRADWEIENAERLSRRIVDALADFDRSSAREREEVLEDIVEVELLERSLARAAVPPSPLAEAAVGRVRAALATIEEAGQNAGLDDLIEEARVRVGLAPPLPDPSAEIRSDPADPVRNRRVGGPHLFRVQATAAGRSLPITWSSHPPTPRRERAEAWWIAVLGLLSAPVLTLGLVRPVSMRRRPMRIVFAIGCVALLVWEPIGTVVALVLVGLGRQVR